MPGTISETTTIPVYIRRVEGNGDAARVVSRLVRDAGMWFDFMPMPDDGYEISVKRENAHRLDAIVAAATERP
jgi:hypothetical protein